MKCFSKKIILISFFFLSLLIISIFFTLKIIPQINEIKNFSIKKITNSEIEVDVELIAYNRSFFRYEIKNMLLNVINNKDTIGLVVSDRVFPFPSKSQKSIYLPIKLKTEKVASLLEKNLDTIRLELIGLTSVKIFFFEFQKDINIPFALPFKESLFNTLNEDLNQEKIIKIKNAKISKIGLTSSQLLINFDLQNPYEISYILLDYPSKVFINDNFSGEGSLQSPIIVDTTSKLNHGTFVFNLNNIDTITSLLRSIFSKNIEYSVKGTLIVKILEYTIRIPYSFNGELE